MNGISFVVNGKARAATREATVADFLHELGLKPPQVLVEYNGEPLQRERFSVTKIADGDRLEIAQMVGGG